MSVTSIPASDHHHHQAPLLKQRSRSRNAAKKTDLSSVITALESYLLACQPPCKNAETQSLASEHVSEHASDSDQRLACDRIRIDAVRFATLAINSFPQNESVEFDRLLKAAMSIAIREASPIWNSAPAEQPSSMTAAAAPKLAKGLRWVSWIRVTTIASGLRSSLVDSGLTKTR